MWAADLAALPGVRVVPAVDAIGRGVLADDQQLAHAGRDQPLGLAQHRMGGARLTSLPRMSGMMQNRHVWLQPSEIFR